jgi:hypothetical protein
VPPDDLPPFALTDFRTMIHCVSRRGKSAGSAVSTDEPLPPGRARFTQLAYKRGEPRVCTMVRAPTPEDEDRRLCRERKTLIAE